MTELVKYRVLEKHGGGAVECFLTVLSIRIDDDEGDGIGNT